MNETIDIQLIERRLGKLTRREFQTMSKQICAFSTPHKDSQRHSPQSGLGESSLRRQPQVYSKGTDNDMNWSVAKQSVLSINL
ncbi:MAG: hypothetical protein NC336_09960, partial [Clostridium sp.]|nr:hypothetical protein [Clostridium sp.]